MEQWKKAGFAGKRDDEALWQRFRGAQEKFFSARKQTFQRPRQRTEAELTVKKALVVIG